MDVMQINESVSVGPQPEEHQLDELAQKGFKTVINLRTDSEDNQELKPDTEGELVRARGMEYHNIPVSMESADPSLVDRFRSKLDAMPKPVYVHCQSGKRAGAFVMMDMGVQNNMTGEEVLNQAKQMGFECDQPELKQFVTQYVNSRSKSGDK